MNGRKLTSTIYCLPLLLTGCSFPHPLQDDVTGLPLADIIKKIACEARDGLDELLSERDLAGKRYEYRWLNQRAYTITRQTLKPLEMRRKKLEDKKKDLDRRKIINAAEQAALAADIDAYIKESGAEYLTETQAGMQKEVLREKAEIFNEVASLVHAVENFNKTFDSAIKKTKGISAAVKKKSKRLLDYYDHEMAYSFRFRIVETNAATASAGWKLPLITNGNVGSISIGAEGGDTKVRDSERNAKLVITFGDLHGMNCDDAPISASGIRTIHYPIKGEIGVREVLSQYFELIDRAERDIELTPEELDRSKSDEPKKRQIFSKTDAYVDTIIFKTTLTASAGPSVTLKPTLREEVTAAIGFSGTREDTHSVTISLSRPSPKEPDKVQTVRVLKEDDIVIRGQQ